MAAELLKLGSLKISPQQWFPDI